MRKKKQVVRNSRQPSPVQIMTHQNQLDNVEYFNYLGSTIPNNERCTREVKYRIAVAKAAFIKKTFSPANWTSIFKEEIVQCSIWCIALYDAEILTPRTVDQKCMESFEMWCSRRTEKICWTVRVSKEEVLHRGKEDRNILKQ